MTGEQEKKWEKVVDAASTDDGLRKRLLSDTVGVLKQHGLEPPAGFQVKIVENTDQVIHMVLPSRHKSAGELSEKDLERVAGGAANAGNDTAPWFRK